MKNKVKLEFHIEIEPATDNQAEIASKMVSACIEAIKIHIEASHKDNKIKVNKKCIFMTSVQMSPRVGIDGELEELSVSKEFNNWLNDNSL